MASAVLPQEPDRALKLLAKAVDLGFGGGEAEAGSGGAREAVMAVQGLGAVVAAADADA